MCELAQGGNGFWGTSACCCIIGAVCTVVVCPAGPAVGQKLGGGGWGGRGGGWKADVMQPLAAMAQVLRSK